MCPCVVGVPEEEEKEQEIGNLFEKIMKENIPNLVKEIDMQVQEAQRVPNKLDLKRATERHIIIKMPKVKDKEGILKAAREKQATLAGMAQWIESKGHWLDSQPGHMPGLWARSPVGDT